VTQTTTDNVINLVCLLLSPNSQQPLTLYQFWILLNRAISVTVTQKVFFRKLVTHDSGSFIYFTSLTIPNIRQVKGKGTHSQNRSLTALRP